MEVKHNSQSHDEISYTFRMGNNILQSSFRQVRVVMPYVGRCERL
jgi:hypothetical protein